MKKTTYSKDGMKQVISSGWRLFDRQTNCISTGNVIADTQFSSFVRPWRETECNGFIRPEGHLMDFDLGPFRKYGIPGRIMDILKDREREDSVILYMFFVCRDDAICPFCWVVTTGEHKLIRSVIVRSYGEHASKRVSALNEILEYITN